MTTPSSDLLARLHGLAARSLKEQMRTNQRFLEMLQQLAPEGPRGERVLRELSRFSRNHSAGYLQDLASLSLGFFQGLLELNRAYNERFFEHVTTPEDPPPAAGEPMEGPPRLGMSLKGAPGAEVTGSLILENRRAEPAQISFVVSPFTGPPGDPPFRVPVRLRPSRFQLAAGEERRVTVVVPLPGELFAPGKSYRASIVVRGYEDLVLDLEVAVEEAQPGKRRTKAKKPAPGGSDAGGSEGAARKGARRKPRGSSPAATGER
jgi:hypothetical protein